MMPSDTETCMQGKVALITGGNSGIGRGIVHRFVRAGATVAFVGRNQKKGEAVLAEVHELEGQGAFFAVDLADESAVIKLVDGVSNRFGRLDVVVNNAGIGSRRGGIEKSDPPGVRWQKLRGPNVDSTYFVSAYTLPLLARSGGGAIVNISSTATLHGNWGLYGVAKAAVEALTRSFAVEGAPHGIRVNCVSPGWIATKEDEELSAAGTAGGEWAMPPSLFNRMGTPAEIAAAVLFLASDDASFVTGQTLIVDGGLTITDYPSIPLLSEVGHRLRSS
ncbi:MAG: SDR family NAD(P)-dependent oxidoreductase [Gammaproteobacteria bacterium]|nr:SDR family NAD(P)-dependent oxidoreductase [Gammaproteobacteria bacterium]